ncbi:MAG: hypothetical protein HY067_01630 [Betaproteobacteria bacterium]|nr:hypothetical protein [Betaproteobacteria bacterium]
MGATAVCVLEEHSSRRNPARGILGADGHSDYDLEEARKQLGRKIDAIERVVA